MKSVKSVHHLTVTDHIIYAVKGKDKHIPQIMLSGKWLEDWGFDINSKVEVCCEEERLVIAKVMPDTDSDSINNPC